MDDPATSFRVAIPTRQPLRPNLSLLQHLPASAACFRPPLRSRAMSGGACSTLPSRGFGSESSAMGNRVGESSASVNGDGGKDSGSFECNICLELAQEPVVTLCGHLFCWPRLYEWLHAHAHSPECPVCKAAIEEEKLVLLYGRGKVSTNSRSGSRSVAGVQIPRRPAGQRPASAPQPDHHHNHYPQPNPWFVGGDPVAGGRWGDYTFSAAIGGLFPLLSFQVHGFPQATAYGPAAYGYGHSFHGWHGHGFLHQAPQGQQIDEYWKWKVLLILVGMLVIASLIAY